MTGNSSLGKKKVFVTGGSGLLGKYLIPLLEAYFTVYSPTHKEFDITQPGKNCLDDFNIFINLAAFTDVSKCETNPIYAQLVNGNGVDWLLLNTPDHAQIYHISTDYVYDGFVENSKETDLPNPWCAYGKSKAAGDTRLLSFSRPNIHIIRTSFKDMKWPYPAAFYDIYTNADYVDNIAKLIFEFIFQSPPGGVYNIGTPPKTYYELATRTNKNIHMLYYDKESFPTLRPNLTMDLSKSKEILGNIKS